MEKGGQMDIIPKKCKKHQICHNKMPPTSDSMYFNVMISINQVLGFWYWCMYLEQLDMQLLNTTMFGIIKYKQVKLGDITGLD